MHPAVTLYRVACGDGWREWAKNMYCLKQKTLDCMSQLIHIEVINKGDTQMTNEQAREVFNQAINSAKNADQIARLELAREYFTNPTFRRGLADHLWSLTK